MEYIQTVLVQIEASRLEQASQTGGLLSELDEHRGFLKQQPGFRDLRVTRSINPEGNILIVVETRWADDEGLVRYETNEPNAAGIVRKHIDVIVPDSLQVLDMEALRTESSWAPAEVAAQARARVTLPLLIPLGVLAFTLLVIYGLSRVYLELSGSAATVLAAGIAIGVLLTAFYLSSNPRVPGWQIGGILVVVAALLTGGSIYAVAQDDEGGAADEEPPATASPGASPGPGGLAVSLGDNFFEYEGQRNPTISVAGGEQVTLNLTNSGKAAHNLHVANENNEFTVDFCEMGGEAICSDPDRIGGGETATLSFTIEKPGTYNFRCDFHPQQMTGQIQVQ